MLTHFAYPCRDTPFVDAEHADQCALHKMYIHKCRYASESKQYMYVCVYLYTYIYIYIHVYLSVRRHIYNHVPAQRHKTQANQDASMYVCIWYACLSVRLPAPPACLLGVCCMYACMYVAWVAWQGMVWHGMLCVTGLACTVLSCQRMYTYRATNACMYVCMYVCRYVCMYVCVCVCMCCTARYGMAWHGMFDGMGLYLLSCQVCKPSESQRQ